MAADARYQGASGGTPRLRDYPSNRIEDISGMVDYLSTLKKAVAVVTMPLVAFLVGIG